MEAYNSINKADKEQVEAILRRIQLEGFDVIAGPDADVQAILDEVAKDGGAQGLMQIGIKSKGITEQVNKFAQDYARERAAEMVGMKRIGDTLIPNPSPRWSINEGTREMLRDTVSEAIDEGWSSQTLAKAVKESHAFSDGRAMNIARTEIAFADAAGNMAAYRESGVVSGKGWLLGPDSCDVCIGNAEAGVIGLDDTFPSGDDTAPAHPHCTCDVIPVVSNEEDE